MVLEHEDEHASRWAAVVSISSKIGCTPQTLHEWVKTAEIDSGKRSGVPSDVSDRLKALERENRELRQANEILRKASAYLALGCFVLGVDHFGKDANAGTRGSGAKESASDLVLACLGDKSLSGKVTNTRLAVRKHRGGQQGQEYPFTLRVVEAPEPDEDRGAYRQPRVVDWQPSTPGGNQAQPGPDPWAQSRRQDQRTAVLRLKRVIMGAMAEHGIERQIRRTGRRSG